MALTLFWCSSSNSSSPSAAFRRTLFPGLKPGAEFCCPFGSNLRIEPHAFFLKSRTSIHKPLCVFCGLGALVPEVTLEMARVRVRVRDEKEKNPIFVPAAAADYHFSW